MIMHYPVNKIPVGILGASGYAGRELCALISQHPRFSLLFATANEQRGQTVRIARHQLTFTATDDAPLEAAAVVFCALPHGASLPWVERARASGARVVDLSSDLRPGNGNSLPSAVYGMPELGSGTRAAICAADIVANPGCYPTSILLALAPFREAYAGERFIEVVSEQPTLNDVVRRNVVRMTATMIAGTRTPTLLVTSAIDNLVKGAAGQAVQNANLMFGFDECDGLPA